MYKKITVMLAVFVCCMVMIIDVYAATGDPKQVIIEYYYTPDPNDLYDEGVGYAIGQLNSTPEYQMKLINGRIDFMMDGAELDQLGIIGFNMAAARQAAKVTTTGPLVEGFYMVAIGTGPNAKYFVARSMANGAAQVTIYMDDQETSPENIAIIKKMPSNPKIAQVNAELIAMGIRQ